MRITSSNVSLSSSSIEIKKGSKEEYFRTWDRNSEVIYQSSSQDEHKLSRSVIPKDTLSIKQQLDPHIIEKMTQETNWSRDTLLEELKEYAGDLRIKIIKDLLEAFTGRKIRLFDSTEFRENEREAQIDSSQSIPKKQEQLPDWGLEYFLRETHFSKEGISFAGEGTVRNADGKTISFSVFMEMSREKYSESTLSIKAGAALIDPLMINISGKGVSFSDAHFLFDLDNDGTKELIHAPTQESAFLILDKNGNGVVDNGSELFGPATGNGFLELSAYDDDSNGWIDESDAIYEKLALWFKETEGKERLLSLKESGIGALYLKPVQTRFDIAAGDSSTSAKAAELRETSIFLYENGSAGLIQEVDMVV